MRGSRANHKMASYLSDLSTGEELQNGAALFCFTVTGILDALHNDRSLQQTRGCAIRMTWQNYVGVQHIVYKIRPRFRLDGPRKLQRLMAEYSLKICRRIRFLIHCYNW